jgi:hypothetical protein
MRLELQPGLHGYHHNSALASGLHGGDNHEIHLDKRESYQ